jgi:hypothetical protein
MNKFFSCRGFGEPSATLSVRQTKGTAVGKAEMSFNFNKGTVN